MASRSIYEAQAPIEMCELHNEEIEMYCYDCRKPICLECGKTLEHSGHNWVTIARASRQVRAELHDKCANVRSTELKKIQDYLQAYEDAKNENVEMIEKIKEQGEIILAAVREVMENQIAQCNYNLKGLEEVYERKKPKLEKFLADINAQVKALEEDGGSMSNLGLINVFNSLDDLLSDFASLSIIKPSLDRFVKGEPNYANLKKMFGNFVPKEKSEFREPVVSKVSSFTHGGDQISHILPIDIDQAWVNCIRSKKIELIDTDGKVHDSKELPNLFNGFSERENGDLVFSSAHEVIKLRRYNRYTTKLVSTGQLIPVSVCQSLDGGLLVTMIDVVSFDIDEDSMRVLNHYSLAGELQKTYEFKDNGTRLFTYPRRVRQNFNTDICVVDLSSLIQGQLCILAAKGGVKCVYTGMENGNEPFCPSDIAFDVYCNILCSDVYNHTIHYLNPAGQFVRYLLTSENCVERPTSVALFNNTLFVGGNTGQIRLYSYRVYTCSLLRNEESGTSSHNFGNMALGAGTENFVAF